MLASLIVGHLFLRGWLAEKTFWSCLETFRNESLEAFKRIVYHSLQLISPCNVLTDRSSLVNDFRLFQNLFNIGFCQATQFHKADQVEGGLAVQRFFGSSYEFCEFASVHVSLFGDGGLYQVLQ